MSRESALRTAHIHSQRARRSRRKLEGAAPRTTGAGGDIQSLVDSKDIIALVLCTVVLVARDEKHSFCLTAARVITLYAFLAH